MTRRLAALIGLAVAAGWVLLAMLVPTWLSFDAHVHFPPVHAEWRPRVGVGSGPAVVLALAVIGGGPRVARRLPWRWLLVGCWFVALAWIVALALVDGVDGLADPAVHKNEYFPTALGVGDVRAMLSDFTSRIPYQARENWPVHVAGHPPGALLFFVGLARLGLESGLAVGLVLCTLGATTPVAVLVALRALGVERAARAASPFLVLGPVAIWVGVSADGGLFAPVAAWGLATLAVAAARRSIRLAVVAGILLGYCAFLSYGLVLLGILAVAILVAARTWRPLVPALVAALGVAAIFLAFGYSWPEAYGVLRVRYYDGLGGERSYLYWVWADLAAFVVSAGLVVGAATALLLRRIRRPGEDRPVVLLGAAAWLTVVAASLSGMSKAEVERIWVPFVPWVLVLTALLPERWQRPAMAFQAVCALTVQHLLWPKW